MCINTLAWGATHMFMFASAPLCILLALVGQFYGCSSSMAASGFGSEYVCNENEKSLFFFNNCWQVVMWVTYLTVTTRLKPDRSFMLALFAPFLVLGVVLIVYSLVAPSAAQQASGAWVGYVASTTVWFGLFGFSWYVHVEPDSRDML